MTTRLAVISDTHGLLRPEVLDRIEECDYIIHGGDINKQEIDGKLWLNPGSCGRRRFDQEITVALMTVDGKHIDIEKVVIPYELSAKNIL